MSTGFHQADFQDECGADAIPDVTDKQELCGDVVAANRRERLG
jgi:hypothetical protein